MWKNKQHNLYMWFADTNNIALTFVLLNPVNVLRPSLPIKIKFVDIPMMWRIKNVTLMSNAIAACADHFD